MSSTQSPLPKDSRLRHLPNAFVSPHVAWYAPETFGRYFSIMVDEFVRFFSGEGLRFELTQRMVDIRHGRSSEERGRSARPAPRKATTTWSLCDREGQLGDARFVEIAEAQRFHFLVLILGRLRQR